MKKSIKAFLLLLCIPCVSSCTLRWNFSIAKPNTSVSSLPVLEKGEASKSVYQECLYNGTNVSYMPSVGEPHILVIPVDFSDYTFQRYGVTNEQAKERIEDAFFGEREDGELVESLSSYYKKSSYGKLNIKGTVTDVVRAPKSSTEYSLLGSNSARIEAIEKIISTALTNYNPVTDFSTYDSDNDGYFDAIWLIYSRPYSPTSDFFWAFTTWSNSFTTYDGKKVCGWSWASYSFFDDGLKTSNPLVYADHPDTHTVIHETGHLLGLDDYYNYDRGNCKYDHPTGDLDMMDVNIGDHMAFSKYNLDWIKPKEVQSSGTYELKPFESSGESYIITYPNYNSTSLWEYFILEYYTPTGLNELDSHNAYDKTDLMYTIPGLRIFHVDAKMYQYNSKAETIYGDPITDFNSIPKTTYYVIGNSNTPSYSYSSDKNIPLVKLNSADKYFDYSSKADNSSLFTLGSSFGKNNVITDTWNDGSSVDFSITVSELNSEKITLEITF